MKAIVVADQTAGTAGMTLVERPDRFNGPPHITTAENGMTNVDGLYAESVFECRP
jgi:hypothetical protein